jgi:predicted TIM-barrel fold metal-dependent hydrolase
MSVRTSACDRRTFVKSAARLSGLALGLGAGLYGCATRETATTVRGERLITPVPYSDGLEPPVMALPTGATDCHHHIFDPRFPRPNGRKGIWGTVDDYRVLRRRLSRSVIASPSSYGFDNTCLVDALDQLGESSRGVAAVRLDDSDAELDRLHRHGVRGIRLYLIGDAPTPPDEFAAYAERIARLGWHIQAVAVSDDALIAAERAFMRLPCTLVIDHLPWPNDAAMLDRLAVWAPDPAIRRRILVDNPSRLYWAT